MNDFYPISSETFCCQRACPGTRNVITVDEEGCRTYVITVYCHGTLVAYAYPDFGLYFRAELGW